MRTVLGIVVAGMAAAGCIAIGPAGVAAADPELNGTYTITIDETQATVSGFPLQNPQVRTSQWVITPCGAGCAHVTNPGAPAFNADMHLVNGRWELVETRTIAAMNNCAVVNTTSLDAATLQGTKELNNHCVDSVITSPATLTPA